MAAFAVRCQLEMGPKRAGGGDVEGGRAAQGAATTGGEVRGGHGGGCGEGRADAGRGIAGVIVVVVVVVVAEKTLDVSPDVVEVIEPVGVHVLGAVNSG